MFKKILIMPHHTETSDNAIDYAARLFPNSEFYIVSAAYLDTDTAAPSYLYRSFLETLSKETIDNTSKLLNKYDIEPETNIIWGESSYEILEYIEKKDIELVVIPIEKRDIFYKLMFHGPDEKVITKAKIPILTVNWQASLRRPLSIFNPTDGLMHSFMASEMAILLAGQFNSKINRIFIGKSKHRYKRAMNWAKEEAERLHIQMKTDCAIGNFHHAVKIMELSHSKNYDLIVMGKGKGLAHGDMLSIVSREIIASAHVPVLVVGS